MSTELTRKQFEARLVQRASVDPNFKRLLLNEPERAIELEFGEAVPIDVDVFVHEETDDTLHFVIPWNPFTVSEGELSDEDLEIVSGGTLDCVGIVLFSAMCTLNAARSEED